METVRELSQHRWKKILLNNCGDKTLQIPPAVKVLLEEKNTSIGIKLSYKCKVKVSITK